MNDVTTLNQIINKALLIKYFNDIKLLQELYSISRKVCNEQMNKIGRGHGKYIMGVNEFEQLQTLVDNLEKLDARIKMLLPKNHDIKDLPIILPRAFNTYKKDVIARVKEKCLTINQ